MKNYVLILTNFSFIRNGNANRLRSLKTLPTKSTPVNALRVNIQCCMLICLSMNIVDKVQSNDLMLVFCYRMQFSRRNLLFAAGALVKNV